MANAVKIQMLDIVFEVILNKYYCNSDQINIYLAFLSCVNRVTCH